MHFQAKAFAATYLRPVSIDCWGMPLGLALDLQPRLYKPAANFKNEQRHKQ
jgi:hypothetical protein